MSKNILKCLSCNEIPNTKTSYQIHTYWKHNADDVPLKSRYRRSKASVEKTTHQSNQCIVNIKQDILEEIEDVKTEKIEVCYERISPILSVDETEDKVSKTEKNGEYFEETISPIKSEADDNEFDEISGDESMDKNAQEATIKIEQNQYLCPVSSCTFTTLTEAVRLLHLKSSHGILEDIKFLKMLG